MIERYNKTVDGKRVRLFQGDCIEGMDALEAESIDVVVTSPPYNLGVKYGNFDDRIPRDRYIEWTEDWAKRVHRLLSSKGSLFLNIGGKPTDPWVPFQVASVFRDLFELQNVIHWIKSISIEDVEFGPDETSENENGSNIGLQVALSLVDDRDTLPTRLANDSERRTITRGHYKPINSFRYVNDCQEYIFHFTKGGNVELNRLAIGVPYQDKANVARWAGAANNLHCRGNTWFIPYETIQRRDDQRPHPATFPPRLPEMCISLHGRERVREVLDPFIGLGNTAVAAVRTGVSVVGYDIDPDYLDVACARLDEEILGKGTRGNDGPTR